MVSNGVVMKAKIYSGESVFNKHSLGETAAIRSDGELSWLRLLSVHR